MVKMSLEKKLKQKAWHHDCITEVVELETAQKELGLVAQQIRGQIEKRVYLTASYHSANPITDHARRAYWEGYIDAKKEDLGLLVEGVPLRNSRVEGATVSAHQDEGSGSLNEQGAKDGSAKSPLRPLKREVKNDEL